MGRWSIRNGQVLQASSRYPPSLPDQALPSLFKPFYRVAEDRDRQTGGAGTGLVITEAPIRQHNDKLNAKNAPVGGLIVSMMLPLTRG